MIRTEKYKLVVLKENKKPLFLFNMDNDPYEMDNLVDCIEYKGVKNDLFSKILSWNEERRFPPLANKG